MCRPRVRGQAQPVIIERKPVCCICKESAAKFRRDGCAPAGNPFLFLDFAGVPLSPCRSFATKSAAVLRVLRQLPASHPCPHPAPPKIGCLDVGTNQKLSRALTPLSSAGKTGARNKSGHHSRNAQDLRLSTHPHLPICTLLAPE